MIDEWSAPREVVEHAHEAPPNLVALAGDGKRSRKSARQAGEPRLLELTFGISSEIYANFLSLREAIGKGARPRSAAAADSAAHLPGPGRRAGGGAGVCDGARAVRGPPSDRAGGDAARRRPAGRRRGPDRARGPARLRRAGRSRARVRPHGGRAGRDALAARLHAEGGGLAGGGAPAGPRDQEPAHPDPARGSGAAIEVPRRRPRLRAACWPPRKRS